MERNAISIIVPVFKVEPYLRRCVNSILAQTYSDFELILVDDGSPDGCPAICDEYAAKDNRIKAIHKQNGGLSSARNVGLDVATGEYVLFVDSDDYIVPETLEKTLACAKANDSDMVIFKQRDVLEDGSEYQEYLKCNAPIRSFEREVCISKRQFWGYYFDFSNYVLWGIACNKLYRKTLFDNVRFEVGRIHEDEIILFDLINKTCKIMFLNEELYVYVHRPSSIMTNINTREKMDMCYAYVKRFICFAKAGEQKEASTTLDVIISFYRNAKGKWSKEDIKKLKRRIYEIRKVNLRTIWNDWPRKRKIVMACHQLNLDIYPFLQKVKSTFHRNGK